MIKSSLILILLMAYSIFQITSTKSCSVYLYQNNPGDDIFNKEKGFLTTWEKDGYGFFSPFQNQHVSFNKFKYFVAVDEDCADCQGAGAGFQREFNEPATFYINLTPGKTQIFDKCVSYFDILCPWNEYGEVHKG